MIQLSRWKIILVVASAIIGCLLAYPNLLSPAQREALPGWLPKNALNLGLDLQGGTSKRADGFSWKPPCVESQR